MKSTLCSALLLVALSFCTIAWSATSEEPAAATQPATPHLDEGIVVVTEFDGGRIHTLIFPDEVVAPTLVVLAGHGAPGGVELFEDTAQYLERASRLADEATSRQGLIDAVLAAYPERKGPFLVQVSALIIFRDQARREKQSSD